MSKKVIDVFGQPEDPIREASTAKPTPPATEEIKQPSVAPLSPETTTAPPIRQLSLKPILIALGVLFIAVFGFRLLFLANTISDSKQTIENQFGVAIAALKEFDLEKARRALGQADSTISNTKSQVADENIFKVAFKDIPLIFNNLFSLGKVTINLADQASNLSENAFNFIMNQRGDELIGGLKNIKDSLDQLSLLGTQLESKAREFGYPEENIAGIDAQVFGATQLLETLVGWLDTEHDQNILVLFQNISEMRPTGGFAGSYAVLTLKRASFYNLEVRDIYDPDGQLKKKVIPPLPLQLITTNWGARDANWFFDFPTSAKKIIQFLEASLIYNERNAKFDAVIAINTDVIADILTITGPIAAPDYDLVITNSNVLEAIQTEVRAGDDRAQGEPKRIIKVLAPLLLDRLGQLTDVQKRELFKLISYHVRQKNVMTYAKDLVIQSYLESLDATGSVFQIPAGFIGDYLAVVNANIGGAKTDAVMTQNINLKSIIDLGGDVHNTLRIERIHAGDTRNEWWYHSDNQNYLQILTPPGSRLTQMTGNTPVTVPSRSAYQTGYETDPDVRVLEKSDLVFGKTVFPAWLTTKIGTKNTIEFRYDLSQSITLQKTPTLYTFVFDRQSGVRGGINAEFKAPAGYYWQESQDRIIQYEDKNPPARTIKTFTLIPGNLAN